MQLKLTLITGRSLSQGVSVEDKFEREYLESVAVAALDEDDMKRLGVREGGRVKIRSAFGEVVVRAVRSKLPCKGVVFVPMGPWANALTSPYTDGSGMPTLKGLEVEVAPTDEEVTPVERLLAGMGRRPLKAVEASGAEDPEGVEGRKVVRHFVCSFCGCLCDDLEVVVSRGRVVEVRGACPLGRAKILGYARNRILHPYVREGNGLRRVSLKEAVRRAAEILVNAKYPLLFGWSSTSVEAIERGLELAELVGGVMDNTSVICHGPTIQALQEVGLVTSTLGQVKNFADLIIYWGCNPLEAHPRHMSRYSAMARGVYRRSRRERKVVVVDVRRTSTARLADVFVKVEPGRDYELISALRMAVRGLDIERDEVAGVPVEQVYELAEIMMSCRFGVVFYGLGVTMTAGKSRNVEELSRLVQDLNEWTKFVLIAMRGHYNVTGANQAFTWTTGYPYSVDFSKGYPRYNPGVTSATDLLLEGSVDAALIVASDPIAHLPRECVRHLLEIPLITIDPKWSLTASVSDVIIPSAVTGVECGGTAYRMDKVPLRLKKAVDPPKGVLPDYEVLEMIISEVRRLKGAG